jgi:outer membrane lipoprotein SlyB
VTEDHGTFRQLPFANHHQEIDMLQRVLAAVVTVLLVASCAESPTVGETEVRQGRITRIDSVSLEGDHQLGLGAIIGGIAGGLLGNQIGGGTGQTVATIAGVLAGGAVGQRVQNRYGERRQGQHIMVDLGGGYAVGITQPVDPDLRVGDRVRIEGSGSDARVLRR